MEELNAGIARALSFILPGWGHVFAGEIVKGIILTFIWGLSLAVFWYSYSSLAVLGTVQALTGSYSKTDDGSVVMLGISGVVAIITWTYSIATADKTL